MIKFIERYRQKKGTDLLQKALSHKYIRRYPKKNGKGYNYVYTDSWKHPFKFLLSVFGLSKEKVVDSYEKNDIQKEYGADKKTWAGHILEYFTNRAKWDVFFSKKENRDRAKKPVKQSVVKAENEEKAKKVQAENKTKAVVNKDKMPINHSLMRKVWSLYSEQGKQVAKEENKVETTKTESVNITNKETNDYGKRSNDFRDLQKASRELSPEDTSLYHSGDKKLDDTMLERLSNVFQREIAKSTDGRSDCLTSLVNPKTNKEVKFVNEVDTDLFHDVFEINQKYLKYGELVDVHESYKDCKCYISENGLSGFAVEPDGNLISVFNISKEKGFLSTVKDYIVEKGATHLDGYNSPDQPLKEIYEKALGFKTASIQDFNEEFDHDNIGKNHDNPQIAFMVMTNSNVETKLFDKDSYNKAKEYQMSIIRESEAEKHQNRSEAMQGNENAKKDGVEVEVDENTRKKNSLRDLLKHAFPNDVDRQLELEAMARSAGTRGRIAREVYKEDYGESVKQEYSPKVERQKRIKAGEKSFNGLKDVLTTNKARTVVNEKLGKVYIEAGETGKSGYGLKHIIEQRYVKDGKTLDETTAICWLVADTVKNGTITRENGRTVEIQNGGIVAIVRKESDDKNAKWVLTGFANSDEEKEATGSIKSVIDDYRYSVEFSSFRTQVGAVISSINNVEQEKPKVNETPKAQVDTITPVGKTSLGENIVNSISTDKATKIPMVKVESIENGKVIFKATPQFKKCLKQLDSFTRRDGIKGVQEYICVADGNLYSTDGRTLMRVKLDGAENLFGAYTYTVENDKVVFSKVDDINELPPYERVIPNYNGEKVVTINNKVLLEKISSMRKEGALGDKKYEKMALEFKNGKCFVEDVEVGNAPNMENGFVCYNAKYLERAIKNSDTSVLNFNEHGDAYRTRALCVSTNVSDVVIMPQNADSVPDYEANRAEYAERDGKLNIQQSLDEETKNKNREMLLDGNKENLKEEELSSLGNYSDQKILNILKVKDLNLEDLSNKCDLTSYESEKYFRNNFGMNSTMVSVIYSCLKEPKFQEAIKKEALNRNLIDETKAKMIFEMGGNSSDEHNNRSEAMKGNQNAKKEFTQADKEAVLKTLNNPTEKMLKVEYTRDNYNKLFPMGEVDTPIGKVKLGEHQFEKLEAKDRKNLLGAMYQTLKEPNCILEDVDSRNRPAKVFIKSFIGEDKVKYTIDVVVNIEGGLVSISFGERKEKQIDKKIKMASISYYLAEGGSPTIGTVNETLPNSHNNTSEVENVNTEESKTDNSDVVTPKFEIDKETVSRIDDNSLNGRGAGKLYQHDLDESIKNFRNQFDVSKMNERQKEYFQERLNKYGAFASESYNDMANKHASAGPSWVVAGPAKYNFNRFNKRMEAERRAFETFEEKEEKFIANTKKHLDELRYDSNSESLEAEKQKVFNDYASGKMSKYAVENIDPFAIEKISGRIKFEEDAHTVTLALYKKMKQNGIKSTLVLDMPENETIKAKMQNELIEEFKAKGMPFKAIKEGLLFPFISNQTANIRRYKERLEQLQKRQQLINEHKESGNESSSNTGKVNFKGGYVYENPEIDRIQIFYDDIPSAEVRSKLKSNGFRWSPSQKAWQRQLNRNGRYAVNQVFKETGIDVELDTINGGLEVKKSLPSFAFKGNKFLIRKSVLKAFCG